METMDINRPPQSRSNVVSDDPEGLSDWIKGIESEWNKKRNTDDFKTLIKDKESIVIRISDKKGDFKQYRLRLQFENGYEASILSEGTLAYNREKSHLFELALMKDNVIIAMTPEIVHRLKTKQELIELLNQIKEMEIN